jgi:PIN domain
MRERIYIDTCALNRPTDDQAQERIRAESEAMAKVLDAAARGAIEWIAGTPVLLELRRNPHPQRRQDALDLLDLAVQLVQPTQLTRIRASQLVSQGYGAFDALHLALAEECRAITLLTVDDRFLRRAASRLPGTTPSVENPIDWVRRRQPWLIKC